MTMNILTSNNAEVSNKKLLREFKLFEAENVRNVSDDSGLILMEGILQKANVPNANNRIYPKTLLEREDKRLQETIQARSLVGSLDHPQSSVIIELRDGSHLITKTWWDGDNLKGEVEVIDTPNGKILQEYIKRNIRVGISSRGLGSTARSSNGFDLVQPDFSMITYDIVSNPSTAGAYMFLKENMYLKESKEWQEFCAANKWVKIETILNEILKLENK